MSGGPGFLHVPGGIEHESVQTQLNALASIEHWTDYWARQARSLFLFDEVSGGSMGRRRDKAEFAIVSSVEFFVSALLYFDSVSHDPIRLYINSPGGDIIGGLALIAFMRSVESPVHTIVAAEAASMAAVIAVAGDRRFAYPQARWLLHRGKSSAQGDADDVAIAAKEIKVRDGQADLIVVNHTKIPPDRLKKMQVKDKWLGTPEALKWGLIDEVIQPSKGPANWLPDKQFLKSLREKEEEEEEASS